MSYKLVLYELDEQKLQDNNIKFDNKFTSDDEIGVHALQSQTVTYQKAQAILDSKFLSDTTYVITCYGGGYNYTPSLFATEAAARQWMYELAYNNICDLYGEPKRTDVDYEKFIKDFAQPPVRETKRDVTVKSVLGLDCHLHISSIVIGSDDNEVVIQFFAIPNDKEIVPTAKEQLIRRMKERLEHDEHDI